MNLQRTLKVQAAATGRELGLVATETEPQARGLADGYKTIVQGLQVRCTGLSGLPAVCAPTLKVLSLTDWVAE